MPFDKEIHFKDRTQAGEMLARQLTQYAGYKQNQPEAC
jgi:predicted phosphoribosyltransferase